MRMRMETAVRMGMVNRTLPQRLGRSGFSNPGNVSLNPGVGVLFIIMFIITFFFYNCTSPGWYLPITIDAQGNNM